MTDYPSVERLAELQKLITELSKVERKVTLGGKGVFENDVEHSYGLAMTCWFLQPKIAPELNIEKIFKYALAHDIVEIHAGDTYFLDTEAVANKDRNERDAIKTLRDDWTDFTDIADFAEGYLNKCDEEAMFVKAVDKILPVLMIGLGEGLDIHRKRNNLTLEALKDNKQSIHVSDKLSPYYDRLFEWLQATEDNRRN